MKKTIEKNVITEQEEALNAEDKPTAEELKEMAPARSEWQVFNALMKPLRKQALTYIRDCIATGTMEKNEAKLAEVFNTAAKSVSNMLFAARVNELSAEEKELLKSLLK